MSTVPFGGRQVVLAGDPFQLEAIIDNSQYEKVGKTSSSCLANICIETYNRQRPGPVQNSLAWFLCFGGFGDGIVTFLNQNHRQNTDPEFFALLNRVRLGRFSALDLGRWNCSSSEHEDIPISYTQLCLRRHIVESVNRERLKDIPGQFYRSLATDTFTTSIRENTQARLDSAAPVLIEAKINSDLILTVTMESYNPGTRVTLQKAVCSDNTLNNLEALNIISSDTWRRNRH